jgi:hypothetical protein
MVVPVLITSCQLSLNRKSGPVTIQMNTVPAARKRAIGLPAIRLVALANRVNQDRDLVGLRKNSTLATFGLRATGSTPNLFGLSPAEALVRQRGADSRIAVEAFGAATSDAAGERVRGPTKGSHQ